MRTYNDIYLSARNLLRQSGVEAFSLEAKLLVAGAAGKTTAAKVIGWIMAAAYVLSILSFVELPAALANVSRIVTVVCMIADIITVITSGKITFFAD